MKINQMNFIEVSKLNFTKQLYSKDLILINYDYCNYKKINPQLIKLLLPKLNFVKNLFHTNLKTKDTSKKIMFKQLFNIKP